VTSYERNPEATKPKKRMSRAKWEMCGKKHRYGTQEKALSAALRYARRTPLMRVYECPRCKGWHLTHRATWEAPESPMPTNKETP